MIEVVLLRGDAETRGRAFGGTRRAAVRAFLEDWLSSLGQAGIGDPHAYIGTMLAQTRFQRTIDECAPQLMAETRGIAEGAGVPLELVLGAQLMDEEWAYRGRWGKAPPRDKCSSVAIRSDTSTTWIGQNMDLGPYTDGHQVLMHIAGSDGRDPALLIFTVGCMIGLMGVSSTLGVCVNALPQLRASTEGLPVAFVLRSLLAAPSLADAVALLRRLPHATGQHYVLADPTGIRSFEASPDGVIEYRAPDPARVLHTNHPLTDIAIDVPAASDWMENSVTRLESLTVRLEHTAADLESVKAALSACDHPRHPVSRAIREGAEEGIGFTTGSMVSALQAGSPVESWVSAGPPHLEPYRRVPLD